MTKRKIQALANDIKAFLKEHYIAEDVRIYYNGICEESKNCDIVFEDLKDPDNNNFTYHCEWVNLGKMDPRDYFIWVAEDHILSMSFEGDLYDVLNYSFGKTEEEFRNIFSKYGLYFELGNSWNLTCFPK